jgi:DNA-binding transcriptional MocR family regulator
MGLSKCLMMGLRLAYIVGPDVAAVERLVAARRGASMVYANPLAASLAAQLIGSGAALGMLAAVRAEAAARRRIAGASLAGIDHAVAGLHVWLPAPSQGCAAERVRRAQESGIMVRGGRSFAIGTAGPAGVRVSLSDAPRPALAGALDRLARIWTS